MPYMCVRDLRGSWVRVCDERARCVCVCLCVFVMCV